MSASPVVADLEAALDAAKADPDSTPEQVAAIEAALAAVQPAAPAAEPADTSGLPGGVDSAPVNEPDTPAPAEPATPAAAPPAAQAPESELDKLETGAETDAVDIITELKEGASISDVANKLLDQDGLTSIVKAIRDLAGKVF
jgi:hypothetical protein